MKVVVTGGTGFVGRCLVSELLAQQQSVTVLTRNSPQARQILGSSASLTLVPYQPLDPQSWVTHLQGSEAIINLVGESLVGSRWTPEKKAAIRDSRIESTRCLVAAIGRMDPKPKVLVSGSAVGYYGPRQSDTALDESSESGQDFLAKLTIDWEAEARQVEAMGVRCVIVRTGIVLGPDGGALGQMLGPFQSFVGGPIGSGEQWVSWIHRSDLVNLILFAINASAVSGVLNGTAPHPVKMAEFCQTLGQVIARPSWLPVPAFVLEVALGESAQVVLTGQRVVPARAQQAGFTFQYPDVRSALQAVLVDR